MPRYFDLNLDLTKIDKNKIFEGKKGKYYRTRVVLKDEPGMYDQIGFVQTASTKEERDNGYEPSYIGNLKEIVWDNNQQGQQAQPQQQQNTAFPSQSAPTQSAADNDMPF